MTVITEPITTATYAKQALVVLSAAPANAAAVTTAELTAGVNISCHHFGDWWPTASTDGVAHQRKMCQTSVTEGKGTTTWTLPALTYSANPQTSGTVGGAGNQAFDVLIPGTSVIVLKFIGVDSKTQPVSTNAYQAFYVDLADRVWAASADDAGGEAQITQAVFFTAGHSGPVDGKVA